MKKNERGLSLIEVTIASVIFMLLSASLYLLVDGSLRAQSNESVSMSMDGQGREALDQIARSLRDTGLPTLVPAGPVNSPTLAFQRVTNYTGGALVYGGPVTFAFVYDEGESDNGLDDNNDGRIDEGVLAWTRPEPYDPPGPVLTTVVTRDLTEGGLQFTQSGSSIIISVTLQRLDPKRIDPATKKPALLTRTYSTTVTLRN